MLLGESRSATDITDRKKVNSFELVVLQGTHDSVG